MQIGAEQLSEHLRRGLAPRYLLYGDEPLLIAEGREAIVAQARACGFGERLTADADAGFDWTALAISVRSPSLFTERRVIDLRLPSGRPGEAGARVLSELAAESGADTLLMVSCGRLDRSARAGKWFAALEACAVVVVAPAVTAERLPGWIARRMQGRGLQPAEDVASLLARHLEGNVLACAQEIERLSLLRGQGPVSVDDIQGNLGENARYSAFALGDACLRGHGTEITRILRGLRAEGEDPVRLLGVLVREARLMAQIAAEVEAGKPAAEAIQAHGVWARRKPLVAAALKRARPRYWLAALQRAARAERVIKGQAPGDPWCVLECLALVLGGVTTAACARPS